MEFKNEVNEKVATKVPKMAKTKKLLNKVKRIKVDDVNVYLRTDVDGIEMSDEVMTISELIAKQKEEPGCVAYIEPHPYSSFIDAKTEVLEPYVKQGDVVKYRKEKFAPRGTDTDLTFIVTTVEFAALGDMSVFIASLNNDDKNVLTDYLQLVE